MKNIQKKKLLFFIKDLLTYSQKQKGMKDVPQYLGKALAKGISGEFKQREQTRTSQNRFTQ